MTHLIDVDKQYTEDIQDVISWCDDMYNAYFASYFIEVRSLFARMQSKSKPITDAELEKILTELPLSLFSVSEVLNNFKLSQEVIKLKIKQTEFNIIQSSDNIKSESKRRESASISTLEDKLLTSAYDSVINRVDKEISFSRELIMGAKKIWDARRRTDDVNPIGEITSDDLPDYDVSSSKRYVKG